MLAPLDCTPWKLIIQQGNLAVSSVDYDRIRKNLFIEEFILDLASKALVFFIAALHLYILIIEMWFWDKPRGIKAFGLKREFAISTKVMAANQGLYNGFLAAGLLWGLVHQQYLFGLQIQFFFLTCIFIAGLYGAYSSSIKILFVQSVPSAIAITFVLINYLNV